MTHQKGYKKIQRSFLFSELCIIQIQEMIDTQIKTNTNKTDTIFIKSGC